MLGPEQSSDYGEYGDDLPREGVRQRGRKKATAAMTHTRKRSTRKRTGGGASTPIAGIGHRRQRRWSW